jgi:hypothetical protein
MTTNRDAEPLIRAWLDLMPDEAPDRVLDSVREAVRVAPQVRWPLVRGPWRSSRMNRFALLASAAAIIAVIGGVAVLGFPDDGFVGPPASSSPTASAAPVPSFDKAPLPDAVVGEWLAAVEGVEALGNTAPRLRLLATLGGIVEVETTEFGNRTLHGVSQPAGSGEIRLVTDQEGVGCDIGDEGRYRWTVTPDDALLTLELGSDDCATRSDTLARTWTRALDGTNRGGRGVVAVFDPMLMVTLPHATFVAYLSPDAAEITDNGQSTRFLALRDPWAASRPCSPEDWGSKEPIAPNADAFVAHLQSLPGFAVETSELEIDGRRAAHLAISTVEDGTCPAHEVVAWTVKNANSVDVWAIQPGDSRSTYAVEVGDDLYLLEWSGGGITTADELDLLSTVLFLTDLPTAP